jgi:hypothetical protein
LLEASIRGNEERSKSTKTTFCFARGKSPKLQSEQLSRPREQIASVRLQDHFNAAIFLVAEGFVELGPSSRRAR